MSNIAAVLGRTRSTFVALLHAIYGYFRRTRTWVHIVSQVEGVAEEDRQILRKSALQSVVRNFYGLGKWRPPQLLDRATIRVKDIGTFHVRANSDDLWHPLKRANGAIFVALKEHTAEGDYVIDAGANIGATAVVLASSVGPNGRVIAIEMMPETAEQLRKNLKLNRAQHVEVVEKALSDVEGEIVSASLSDGSFGEASIVVELDGIKEANIREVQTTTLDAIAVDVVEISLLKIDLEGAEFLALQGGRSMLQRTKRVLFESWDADGGETGAFLKKNGFEIEPIDRINFLALRGD